MKYAIFLQHHTKSACQWKIAPGLSLLSRKKPGGLYLGIVRDGAPWKKIAKGTGVDRKPGHSEPYRIFSAELIIGKRRDL